MSHSAHVEDLPFDTAEDFVAFLRPCPRNWGPLLDHSCTWVYRGHSDAEWKLIPSAWRDETRGILDRVKAKLRPEIEARLQQYPAPDLGSLACSREHAIEHMAQVEAEVHLVAEFGVLADELGYPVPDLENIRTPRNSLAEYRKNLVPNGPKPNVAFALAQHHGIPTRLLDWTRKPLVAAFFAANGIECLRQRGHTPTHLAIWALNWNFKSNQAWRFLECPRHKFSFLHAQDGLFTWLLTGDHFFVEHGKWPPFEEHLQPWEALPKPLRKLTLPAERAEDLLQILWRERISTAHLMPTYDNVTTALLTKWRWR